MAEHIAVYSIRAIHFDFAHPDRTEVYAILDAAPGAPPDVHGCHHKSFPPTLSAVDILRDHFEDHVLWPRVASYGLYLSPPTPARSP